MLWPAVREFLDRDESRTSARIGQQQLGGERRAHCYRQTAAGQRYASGIELPSIWYEIHLTAPGWNVKGFTLPGAPLVVIGHNDHIAWGFTNNGADVQDLYIETFNPAAPDEYRVNGRLEKSASF